MSQLTDNDMTTWHVTYRDDRPRLTVTAAYPATDPLMPGWVALKDSRHKIVAMVPTDQAVSIERCPNDPHAIAPLIASLIGDGSRGISGLPRKFGDLTDVGEVEMALRTQLVRELLRARVTEDGCAEFYAYLRAPGGSETGDLVLEYGEQESFGPYVRAVLTGIREPVLVPEPIRAPSRGKTA